MTIETFAALLIFAAATSLTPGPNNLMLLASGVNFGFWRTIPHMVGVAGGFAVLLLSVGFGLGAALAAFPALNTVLKVLGGVYLLYLAWRIATTGPIARGRVGAAPMSFLAAAAFQWVNPKAWFMAITAMSLYTSASAPIISILLVTTGFVLVNLPSVSMWAGFGTVLSRVLDDPARLKWFNVGMGLLLAASIVPLIG
ncbi:MAG: LysE family translocator [Hyphomicrobiales bacterium]